MAHPTLEEKYQDLKRILEEPDNSVDMNNYVSVSNGYTYPRNERASHCGNIACIAGHLMLSKLFQGNGGSMELESDIGPIYRGTGAKAVRMWFENNNKLNTRSLIYGHGVERWDSWNKHDAVLALDIYKNKQDLENSRFVQLLNLITDKEE